MFLIVGTPQSKVTCKIERKGVAPLTRYKMDKFNISRKTALLIGDNLIPIIGRRHCWAFPLFDVNEIIGKEVELHIKDIIEYKEGKRTLVLDGYKIK